MMKQSTKVDFMWLKVWGVASISFSLAGSPLSPRNVLLVKNYLTDLKGTSFLGLVHVNV